MNKKNVGMALVSFVSCIFFASGSSAASVVLSLLNPIQEVRKDFYKRGTLLGHHLDEIDKDDFYRCQKP